MHNQKAFKFLSFTGCIGIRSVIALSIMLICFIMPALLFYYLGYEGPKDWDEKAIKTQCLIIDHFVQRIACGFACNCSGTPKNQDCQTCYQPCYDGFIIVSFYTDKINLPNTSTVFNSTYNTTSDNIVSAIDVFRQYLRKPMSRIH